MEFAKERITKFYKCRKLIYPDYKKPQKNVHCTCYQENGFEPNIHLEAGRAVYGSYPCTYYRREYPRGTTHVYTRYKDQYTRQSETNVPDGKCTNEYCQLCEDEKNLRLIETWKNFQMQRRVSIVNRFERETRVMCSEVSTPKEREYKPNPKSLDVSFEKQRQKKKFQCLYCSKSFAKSSHLRDHHRTHSGERPFVCKYCSKAFSQFSNLRTHLRIHTGEKPFRCTICQKAFTQRVTLRSHIRTHSS